MSNGKLISYLEDLAVENLSQAIQFLVNALRDKEMKHTALDKLYLNLRQLEGNLRELEKEKEQQTSSPDQIRAGINQVRLSFLKMLGRLREMEELGIEVPEVPDGHKVDTSLKDSPRVQTLLAHIQRAYKLISEYETQLILSDDPKQQARGELRIQEQQAFIERFARELAEIRGEKYNEAFLRNLKKDLGH